MKRRRFFVRFVSFILAFMVVFTSFDSSVYGAVEDVVNVSVDDPYGVMPVVSEGYHLEYHSGHSPVYVGDVYDSGYHDDCGGAYDYNAKEYIVSCGSTQYERYRWGWYVFVRS